MSDEVSIVVAGQRISGWTGVTIEMGINNCVDGFSISMPFNPERIELRERFKPFKYQSCKIYIDDELIITGRIENIESNDSINNQMITVHGRNSIGIILDCYIDDRFQFNGLRLADILIQLTKKYDIKVHYINNTDPIQECTAKPGQKIFEFAANLAGGFGLLLSSNEKGWLIISYPPKAGKPVAAIIAGQSPYIGGNASYNGSARFSQYKVVGSDYGTPGVVGIAEDPGVPIYRHSVEALGEASPADVRRAARHKRAIALAGVAKNNITVSGWRDANNALWKKGSTVTLFAPSLMVYQETAFVVAGITLRIDEPQGRVSDLRLVLPQTFEDKMPEVYPWD